MSPGKSRGELACAYEQTETATMKRYTGDNLAISNAMASNPAFESGGAGLVSTLDDYARFGKMLPKWRSTERSPCIEPRRSAFFDDRRAERTVSESGALENFRAAGIYLFQSDADCRQATDELYAFRGRRVWLGWLAWLLFCKSSRRRRSRSCLCSSARTAALFR